MQKRWSGKGVQEILTGTVKYHVLLSHIYVIPMEVSKINCRTEGQRIWAWLFHCEEDSTHGENILHEFMKTYADIHRQQTFPSH